MHVDDIALPDEHGAYMRMIADEQWLLAGEHMAYMRMIADEQIVILYVLVKCPALSGDC